MKFKIVSAIIIYLIVGFPFLVSLAPLFLIESPIFIFTYIPFAALLYIFTYSLTAAILSTPFQKAIVKGTFPRDLNSPLYSARRLYGLCWTMLYYNKIFYNVILNFPLFKNPIFRLFGYKGSLSFTTYPDSWIRDLPLLFIEDNAYIANRATLGTNILTNDGNIIVGRIVLKKNSMVGHLAVLGLGVALGENTEIGVRCQIGIHTKIGDNVNIGGMSGIGHFVKIGNNTHIGIRSFVGTRSTIGDGLNLPSDIRIPDGTEVLTQEDVEKYVQSVPQTSEDVIQTVFESFRKRKPH